MKITETFFAKFWKEHNPYHNCTGQYMTAVWYYNDEQKAVIDASIDSLGGDEKVKTTGLALTHIAQLEWMCDLFALIE